MGATSSGFWLHFPVSCSTGAAKNPRLAFLYLYEGRPVRRVMRINIRSVGEGTSPSATFLLYLQERDYRDWHHSFVSPLALSSLFLPLAQLMRHLSFEYTMFR